jgi:hypothetical protein
MQLQCGRRCRRGFASKDSFELAAALTANLSMGGGGERRGRAVVGKEDS